MSMSIDKMPSSSVLELVQKNAGVEEYESIEWRPLWRAALATMTAGVVPSEAKEVTVPAPVPSLPPLIERSEKKSKRRQTPQKVAAPMNIKYDHNLPKKIAPVLRRKQLGNDSDQKLKNMLANVSKQKKERLLAMLIELEDDLNDDLSHQETTSYHHPRSPVFPPSSHHSPPKHTQQGRQQRYHNRRLPSADFDDDDHEENKCYHDTHNNNDNHDDDDALGLLSST